MAVILHDVPSHVRYTDSVQSSVLVKGGTNWDLSRSALETPVQFIEIKPPASARVKEKPPSVWNLPSLETVYFRPGSIFLAKSDLAKLRKVARGSHVIVTGFASSEEKHPEELASRRALAASAYLGRVGVKVDTVKSLSDSLQVPGPDYLNRKVVVSPSP